MDDLGPRLDRRSERFVLPADALERTLTRRDRRRRNERIVSFVVVGLLITIICGVVLLDSHSRSGTAPGGPTASPTTLPGPISRELVSGLNQRLQPGPHWLSRGEMFISFDVPAGWRSFGDLAVSGPAGAAVGFWFADEVPLDPCNWKKASRDPGASVDGLVAALGAQPGTTAPVDVTLAGYPGQSMQLRAPIGGSLTDFKDCDAALVGTNRFEHIYVRWWMGDSWFGEQPNQRDRLWILDVHGERLVVVAQTFPNTSQRTRAQVESIVRSLRIT